MRCRCISRAAVAVASATALLASLNVLAVAQPADGPLPARSVEAAPPDAADDAMVDAARAAESAAATEVARAEDQLTDIASRLAILEMSAAAAVEAANDARLTSEAAGAEADRTAARARAAAAELEDAELRLGRLAAAAYRIGGDLSTVGLVLDAGTEREVFDAVAALRAITEAQNSVVLRWKAARIAAAATAMEAESAAVRAQEAERQAAEAAAGAEAAVAEQLAAISAAEAERDALLVELARARDTTVALESARHEALAAATARRRQREAEQEALETVLVAAPVPGPAEQPAEESAGLDDDQDPGVSETEAKPSGPVAVPTAPAERQETGNAPQQQAGVAPAPRGPRDETRTAPAAQPPAATPTPSRTASTSPKPRPSSSAAPKTTPSPTAGRHYTEAGARKAVDWARTQLGKPYQWGAAGPNSYDCSGLTMRAWQRGGVSLPHSSGGQARGITRVAYRDLRAGDLIFWSDNGQASGVYHVGLAIGGGRMIHAPRPGKVVEIQSVFYWVTPSFYGRV